jgi:hypothetical protein
MQSPALSAAAFLKINICAGIVVTRSSAAAIQGPKRRIAAMSRIEAVVIEPPRGSGTEAPRPRGGAPPRP